MPDSKTMSNNNANPANIAPSLHWTAHGQPVDCRSLAISEDGQVIAAAIMGGAILRSTDGGSTWPETSSGSGQWSCVASSRDGHRLLAAERDYGGAKLWSEANGWTSISGISGNWASATSSSDGSLLALANNGGQLHVSKDFGATWSRVGEPAYWNCIASSLDGDTLVAGATNKELAISYDKGESWTALANSGRRVWKSIAVSADGSRMVATVQMGGVFVGTKSGTTWSFVERITAVGQWTSVAMSDDGQRILVANSGEKLHFSDDGGVTWTAQGDTQNWAAVASSKDGSKLIAGIWDGSIHACAPSQTTAPGAPDIVISGFEPFGGGTQNASWTLVQALQQAYPSFHARKLPVVWGAPLAAIAAEKPLPKVWIAFGEGTSKFQIEMVARNERGSFKDNQDNLPPTPQIVPAGAATLRNPASTTAIAAALSSAGCPTIESSDAGAFLCEEMLYSLLHTQAQQGAALRLVLFIHVPPHGTIIGPAGRIADASSLADFGRHLVTTLQQQNLINLPSA